MLSFFHWLIDGGLHFCLLNHDLFIQLEATPLLSASNMSEDGSVLHRQGINKYLRVHPYWNLLVHEMQAFYLQLLGTLQVPLQLVPI